MTLTSRLTLVDQEPQAHRVQFSSHFAQEGNVYPSFGLANGIFLLFLGDLKRMRH